MSHYRKEQQMQPLKALLAFLADLAAEPRPATGNALAARPTALGPGNGGRP